MRKFFALRKEVFFLSQSALFSFGGKEVFLPGEIDFPPKEKSPPCEGKKPGVRREKKRRAKGDFFFARTEINFLTYENFGPSPSVLFTPAEAFPEPSYERAGEGAIRRAKERLAKSLRGHRQILP